MPYRAVAEPRDGRFPFALNTGRLRDQWHGMSRTGTLGRRFGHAPEPVVELHAQDMARLRLVDGQLAQLRSRCGTVVLPARQSDAVAPAQAFVARHWGDEFLSGGVNTLTSPAPCPHSRQPELKHAALEVNRAELPWPLLALAWLDDEAAAWQAGLQLRSLFTPFGFASCVPFGRERAGLLFRAAAAAPVDTGVIDRLCSLLGLTGPQALHCADPRRAAPGAQPPGQVPAPVRQVCSCFDVLASQTVATLIACQGSSQERLAALQRALRCGTQCGSCLPALRRLVQAQPLPA